MDKTVNEKGHIGLIKVMADLSEKGYECFLPVHDYSAVDLIVIDELYQPIKLQVKYRKFDNNLIEIPYTSVVNGKQVPINKDAIDGWAIYCPDTDTIAYINKIDLDLTKVTIRLRLVEGKCCNKNKVPSPLFVDFKDEKRLWVSGEMVAALVC